MRAMVRAAPIAVWLILSPSITDANIEGFGADPRLRASFIELREKVEMITGQAMTGISCSPSDCLGTIAGNAVHVMWWPGGFKMADVASLSSSGLTAFPAACTALFAHMAGFDFQTGEAVLMQMVEHAQQGGTARGSIGDVDFRFGFDRANLPKCEATLRERL